MNLSIPGFQGKFEHNADRSLKVSLHVHLDVPVVDKVHIEPLTSTDWESMYGSLLILLVAADN